MEPLRRLPLLDFTLRSKRSIWARSYFILETYAGILEGTPDEKFNERMLQSLPDRLRTIFGGLPVHILEPTLVFSELASQRRGYEVLLLPPVCIAAVFTSSPARDESMHASGLTIAWFQEHDFPIVSEENQLRLSEMIWEETAVDFEY
jgi:hypothetical protein